MFRQLSKLNVLVLILISLLFGGMLRFAFSSSAASTITVKIAVSPAGAGKVTGKNISCPSTCSTAFPQISTAKNLYTATPSAGYQFLGWNNNPRVHSNLTYDYVANPLSISQATNWNFTAYFGKIPPVVAPPIAVTPPAPAAPSSDSTDSWDDSGSGEVIVQDEQADTTPSDQSTESADKEAPTIPTNVQAAFDKDQNSINLTWDDSTDNSSVSGYEVQRQEKGGTTWDSVGNVGTGEFTDFQFAPNKTYEYQVRAYDTAKNFSGWSESVEVVSGDFNANVTAADGGSVTDEAGVVTVEVPKGATSTDLVILINKVSVKGLTLPANTKLVGSYYDIKAKDAQGNEVKKFSRQIVIKFNYGKVKTSGVLKSTLAIATALDSNSVEAMKTSLNGTEATTLTDHFSIYFLAAEKTGVWVTLLWILLWLTVIGGLIFAGYYGWKRYQLYQYQKAHSEDFIYKH